MSLTRRTFMGAAGAALVMTAGASRRGAAAPSERLRVAVLGLGGQGTHHVRLLSQLADSEVVAVCDLDPERLPRGIEASGNANIVQEKDYRRILDDDSIDAVSIATPDHWHTPLALHALAAGKHVYVEKPCCHNPAEGWALEAAAKKTGLCVQHGTQHRSGEARQAIEMLHGGVLGKVRAAKAINHQFREPIGRAEPSTPPAGVDYDLWTGPAPLRPFTENRWHYNWHWVWELGCGDLGNDGIHQLDVARWGLNAAWPKRITCPGGQYFYDDDHETPDWQTASYEYDDFVLFYEMRLWTNYPIEGHDNGVVFYGDDGTMEIGRKGSFITKIGGEPERVGGSHDIAANFANFVASAKAGDPKLLNAPVEEAVLSANLCHFGNIATRIGRALDFDAGAKTFKGDDEANAMLARSYRDGYELPTV